MHAAEGKPVFAGGERIAAVASGKWRVPREARDEIAIRQPSVFTRIRAAAIVCPGDCFTGMHAPSGIVTAVFWLLGGLALFLYGVEVMTRALRRAAGLSLRNAVARTTRTRLRGLLTGTLVTVLLQSSSAATVMVVGFIHAGLLSFGQSVSVILGANLGTTVTPQVMAFDLDRCALPALGIGFLLSALAQKRMLRQTGRVVMGFGMLFFGLTLMKDSVSGYGEPLRAWLSGHTAGGFGQALAFLAAAGVTAVIQSSAATIVIVQALAFQGAIGNIEAAIPLILGAQVGTCVTALLASLQASLSARRAAVAHLVFNLAGAGLTLALFRFYVWWMPGTASGLPRQIANCHLAIKVVNVALFLPLAGLFGRLVSGVVRGRDLLGAAPAFLRYDEIGDPRRAIAHATREITRMCGLCLDILRDAVSAVLARDEVAQELVVQREERIDDLYKAAAHYLLACSRQPLPPDLAARPPLLLHIMSDVERIGDHAENIVEMGEIYARREAALGASAVAEIQRLARQINDLGRLAVQALEEPSPDRADAVLRGKEELNDTVDTLLDRHAARIAEGSSTVVAGIVFLELVMNLRRVANHLRNIAVSAAGRAPEHTRRARDADE